AAIQARAAAIDTGSLADVLRQLLAHRRGFGFPVAALQVREDALETVPALATAAGIGEIAEGDRLLATAVQDRLTHAFAEVLPGGVDAETVMARQRRDQLEVIRIAPIPAAHGTGGERQIRMHDHAG